MPNPNKQIRSCRKALYRIKNWAAYEQALVQRGSLTVWLSADFEQTWCHVGQKQRGAQFTYSDRAIGIMLTMKAVFHLTNREVEGFVRSLFKLLNLTLAVPDHSTLSKRGKALKVQLPKHSGGRRTIVMDSTGLKISSLKTTWAKANGKCARMVHPNAAPGANCMWASIPIVVKFKPPP